MRIKKIFSRRIILALFSILLAAVLTFVAIPKLALEKTEAAEVLVFTEDYAKGAKIEEKMLSFSERGIYGHKGLFFNKDEVIGSYLLQDVKQGDLVNSNKLSKDSVIADSYLENIDPNKYAISVSVQSFPKGLSAKLVANDIVSIIKVIEESRVNENQELEKTSKGKISPFLEYVRVLSVTYPTAIDAKEDDKRNPDEVNENKLPTTLTLLVDRKQAEELAALEENGVIHVALKYRGINFEDYVKKQDELNKKTIEFEKAISEKEQREKYGIEEPSGKTEDTSTEGAKNGNKE